MITCHSDHVGSLLRPADLVAARADAAAGRMPPARFKAVEDRAVAAAIALQERVGLSVVTDGEQRRLSFQGQFAESVDGLGPWDADAFLWGDWHSDDAAVGELRLERPPELGAVAKLRRRRHLSVEEFVFLRGRTSRLPKVTLPSPSLWSNFWSARRSGAAYPTLDGFLADVVDILRDEVAELVRLGATYIQLDAPHYTLMLDPATRAFYESRGWGAEGYLERGIEMDNAVMGDFPGVTFGFHLCRGNQGSRWLASGGYEAIARPIFRRIRAERLLLEYDDPRSGSFEALKEVPDDKFVVLGLVSTKHPRLESVDGVIARIRDASRFLPLERLGLSPQCGFATSVMGNALGAADQEAKLRLVVEVARRVWGEEVPRESGNGSDPASPGIESISAVTLATGDMARAVGFYRALGFAIRYGGARAEFTSFHAGPGYLNLIAGGAEQRWSGWGRVIVHVSDVDALYRRALAQGLRPEFPPRDAPWGERYFHISDPDGHELSLARPIG